MLNGIKYGVALNIVFWSLLTMMDASRTISILTNDPTSIRPIVLLMFIGTMIEAVKQYKKV